MRAEKEIQSIDTELDRSLEKIEDIDEQMNLDMGEVKPFPLYRFIDETLENADRIHSRYKLIKQSKDDLLQSIIQCKAILETIKNISHGDIDGNINQLDINDEIQSIVCMDKKYSQLISDAISNKSTKEHVFNIIENYHKTLKAYSLKQDTLNKFIDGNSRYEKNKQIILKERKQG